jgi:hypothetical protein
LKLISQKVAWQFGSTFLCLQSILSLEVRQEARVPSNLFVHHPIVLRVDLDGGYEHGLLLLFLPRLPFRPVLRGLKVFFLHLLLLFRLRLDLNILDLLAKNFHDLLLNRI